MKMVDLCIYAINFIYILIWESMLNAETHLRYSQVVYFALGLYIYLFVFLHLIFYLLHLDLVI